MRDQIIHERVVFQTLKEPQIRRLLAESVASEAGLDLDAEGVTYKVLIHRDTVTSSYEAKVTITESLGRSVEESVFTVICALQDRASTSTYHTSVASDSSKEAAKLALEECAEAWECDVDDLVVIGMYRGRVPLAAWDDDGMTLDEIPEL